MIKGDSLMFRGRLRGTALWGGSLLLAGCMLNIFLQAASLGMKFGAVADWVARYPALYLAGSLFLFFLLLLFAALVPGGYPGPLLAVAVVVLLGTADNRKLATTGEPLFPWDLMLLKNAGEMRHITRGMLSPLWIAIAAALIVLLLYGMRKLPKVRMRLTWRLLLGGVSAALAGGFLFVVGSGSSLASSLHYENLYWNQKVNYTQNGFLFAFAGNLHQNVMEKPDGYSREAILRIAAKYGGNGSEAANPAPTGGTEAEQDAKMPDILFMMDEAFFDPTRLPGYSFSADPLVFIHGAAKSSPSGYLLSPEFGGNTANVEFEALTGLSMYFLNDGSVPFQQRLVKMSSLPSIVSILKQRGYAALALHPFDDTFYNRNRVYPMLGFDRFTSEKDLPKAARMTPGGYISDLAAVQEAVRELRASKGPAFLHLVTMQNHFPFTSGKNGPNTIAVSSGKEAYRKELETYAQDAKLTDEALAELAKELKELPRRTVAVFWGDHLPALSAGIYAEAGWDAKPRLKHETKLMLLANFDIGTEGTGTLSPAFLGPEVFRRAGLAEPPFYQLLDRVKAELPGLSGSVRIGSGGNEIRKLTPEQQALLSDYRLVEYDLLEGKQYSAKLMF